MPKASIEICPCAQFGFNSRLKDRTQKAALSLQEPHALVNQLAADGRKIPFSPDTALRDMSDLLARGVLLKTEGSGRGTGHVLNTQIQ